MDLVLTLLLRDNGMKQIITKHLC